MWTRSCTWGSVATEAGQDIRDRSFLFARDITKLALSVARPGTRPVTDQLIKSGTSVGANLEEAKAASSRREFVRYLDIALREARESTYWLRICLSLDLEPKVEIERLRNEGDQIARILGAIVVKTRIRGL
ncbi:MAG: four helix bundle protein [Acidobacteria bacterium]|nr:four helix bundle protein [Acidobacteriota bacterium]